MLRYTYKDITAHFMVKESDDLYTIMLSFTDGSGFEIPFKVIERYDDIEFRYNGVTDLLDAVDVTRIVLEGYRTPREKVRVYLTEDEERVHYDLVEIVSPDEHEFNVIYCPAWGEKIN